MYNQELNLEAMELINGAGDTDDTELTAKDLLEKAEDTFNEVKDKVVIGVVQTAAAVANGVGSAWDTVVSVTTGIFDNFTNWF
ncbi:MAG: hypothetical protein IJI38_00240 [Clostridia bacterium]|nr:hypothetical protein [Clostridia bacterium]